MCDAVQWFTKFAISFDRYSYGFTYTRIGVKSSFGKIRFALLTENALHGVCYTYCACSAASHVAFDIAKLKAVYNLICDKNGIKFYELFSILCIRRECI